MPGTLVRQKPSMTTVPRSVLTPSFSSPSPSTLPVTPTAEMTRSTAIDCFWFLPPSTCATTPVPFFSTAVTLAPVRILMPCFSNDLRASAAISASSTGRICGNTSTTVTSEPSVRKNEANSMPIAPEPMTSSDFGIFSGTIASK